MTITTVQCTFRRHSLSHPKERGFAVTRNQKPLFIIPEHVQDEVDTLPIAEVNDLALDFNLPTLSLDIPL